MTGWECSRESTKQSEEADLFKDPLSSEKTWVDAVY